MGGLAPPANWNLASIDGAGKVTFNNTSLTGSVGSVTGSVGSISGITFPANFGTFSVDTSGRVTLVPGQSTVASNFVAAPSVAVDGSGRVLLQPTQAGVTIPTVGTVTSSVTVGTNNDKTGYTATASNLPSDYLSTGEQAKLLAASTSAQAGTAPTWYTAPANPATVALGTQDEGVLGNLSSMIQGSGGTAKYTASALSLAPTGGGGGGGGDTPGTTTLLTRLPQALLFDGGGNLKAQVASYGAGQDPFTLVMAGSILTIPTTGTTTGTSEVLTFKQTLALHASLSAGGESNTAATAGGTATVTYYLVGAPKIAGNVVAVSTPSFDTNGKLTGRVVLVQQPFPVVQ